MQDFGLVQGWGEALFCLPMAEFTCESCGATFTLGQATLDKYPGWIPRRCLRCRDQKKPSGQAGGKPAEARSTARPRTATASENLTVAEVLRRFDRGPKTGIFTDGSAQPNPGPGGFGAVCVIDDQIVDQRHGHESHTTNNRMELTALIAGYRMAPPKTRLTVFTDSELCVKSMTQWAAAWKARGWRRSGGEIKNLELVQELYDLYLARPELELKWIQAHDGSRWNEYADALSTAWARSKL